MTGLKNTVSKPYFSAKSTFGQDSINSKSLSNVIKLTTGYLSESTLMPPV